MPQRSLPKYACQLNRNLRNHFNVFLSLNRHKTSFFSNRIYHINHSQSLTPFPQYLRKKWILGKLMQSKNVCTKDQSKSSSSRCVLNAHDQGPITDVITK